MNGILRVIGRMDALTLGENQWPLIIIPLQRIRIMGTEKYMTIQNRIIPS
jgi:hypothetical protein